MIDRRQLLARIYGSVVVGVCTCSGALARSNGSRGCLVGAREFHATRKLAPSSTNDLSVVSEFRGKLLPTSQNRRFDEALGEVLAQMAHSFGVTPGFAFFDERDLPNRGPMNAVATTAAHVRNTTGTVLFGLNMLKFLLSLPGGGGDFAVLAVCAHEFAHIRQFEQQRDGSKGVEEKFDYLVELHADFLAGWYAWQFAQVVPETDNAAITRALASLGDSPSSVEPSHGTAEQRVKAFHAGQDFGRVGARGIDNALLGADAHIRVLATP